MYVVLLSAQWGGPNGIEAWSLGLHLLQCFDNVGWALLNSTHWILQLNSFFISAVV